MSPEQMVGSMSETILDKFGEKKFDVEDIARSLEEAGPYQNVFMQVSKLPTLSVARIFHAHPLIFGSQSSLRNPKGFQMVELTGTCPNIQQTRRPTAM